jgi:hypothetical protein
LLNVKLSPSLIIDESALKPSPLIVIKVPPFVDPNCGVIDVIAETNLTK